ncbi:TBC1 domain family member 10B [Elysia marginata]|uniref:TBC1 domain family member 10B n=1 Tax=Elysia marginata TaxID=1093978 RepID=A0AAV4H239_9GAST|nr:TBC1 domain family member 10B [Elysia marginata]
MVMAMANHLSEAGEDDLNQPDDNKANGGSPKQHAVNGSAFDSFEAFNTLVKTDRYGFLGGNQYTNPEDEKRLPQEKLRKRETKWLDMFVNWDKWMSKKFKKKPEHQTVDVKLRESMRTIGGCLKSMPIQWLPTISPIAPPHIRREDVTQKIIKTIEDMADNIPLKLKKYTRKPKQQED